MKNNPLNRKDPLGLWQLTVGGGELFGGMLTFGSNSSQWNFGAYTGVGEGLFGRLDLGDSGGCHKFGAYGSMNIDLEIPGAMQECTPRSISVVEAKVVAGGTGMGLALGAEAGTVGMASPIAAYVAVQGAGLFVQCVTKVHSRPQTEIMEKQERGSRKRITVLETPDLGGTDEYRRMQFVTLPLRWRHEAPSELDNLDNRVLLERLNRFPVQLADLATASWGSIRRGGGFGG